MAARTSLKNIVENVQGSELPAKFLGPIDPSHRLRVTVEDVEATTKPADRIRAFAGIAKTRDTSIESAVERIRLLRDEAPDAP